MTRYKSIVGGLECCHNHRLTRTADDCAAMRHPRLVDIIRWEVIRTDGQPLTSEEQATLWDYWEELRENSSYPDEDED